MKSDDFTRLAIDARYARDSRNKSGYSTCEVTMAEMETILAALDLAAKVEPTLREKLRTYRVVYVEAHDAQEDAAARAANLVELVLLHLARKLGIDVNGGGDGE